MERLFTNSELGRPVVHVVCVQVCYEEGNQCGRGVTQAAGRQSCTTEAPTEASRRLLSAERERSFTEGGGQTDR